jgi:DNA-binding MarR family transcriptional regulator
VEELTPFDPEYHLDVDRKIAAALERIGQGMKVMLWDEAKRHGLSPLQVGALTNLLHAPDGSGRVGQLARESDVSQPTMSDAVAALEKKGLIHKGPAATDSRSSALALTAKGRALAVQLSGWSEPLRNRLGDLPEEGKVTVMRFLYDVIASLQQARFITVARMCISCRYFRPDGDPTEPGRHFCALLKVPLPESALRIDCPEHELASSQR